MTGRETVSLWVLAVVLVTQLTWAWWCRHDQGRWWSEQPEAYVADGMPLMTSFDSYKWLRYADEFRDGSYGAGEPDPLMAYPDGLARPDPVPLPSVLLGLPPTPNVAVPSLSQTLLNPLLLSKMSTV